jgi:hypothetical protein
MAQSVERRLGKAEVTGSIPVISLYEKTQYFQDSLNLLGFPFILFLPK